MFVTEYPLPIPFRRVALFFALGVASHLVSDILFDFPLIYFANNVDDMGGVWFFPYQPFIIRYEEPGFNIQPWELLLEGAFLLWMFRMWKRWDLVVFGSVISIGTALWLVVGP